MNIRQAKTNEEKEGVFLFLQKMWKELFDIDINSRTTVFADILFFIEKDGSVMGALELRQVNKSHDYFPIGSSVLQRLGIDENYRGQ